MYQCDSKKEKNNQFDCDKTCHEVSVSKTATNKLGWKVEVKIILKQTKPIWEDKISFMFFN